jgi:hypothetical protein
MLSIAGSLFASDAPNDVSSAESKGAVKSRLEEVLQAWSKASAAIQQEHVIVHRTEIDRVRDEKVVADMEIWFRKPDLLRIDDKEVKNDRKQFFYTKGKEVHWYANGEDRVIALSPEFGYPENPSRYPDTFWAEEGGQILEQLSWIGCGLPVKDLKKDWDVRLTKEDDHWIYLELKPRTQRYRNNVTYLQVVLGRKDMRVRRIFFQLKINNVTFDYEKPDTATPVTPESIVRGLPVGWKPAKIDSFLTPP